jgi:hypothetical protein
MTKLNIPVEAIEAYTAFVKNDYAMWWRRGEKQADSVSEQMIVEFNVFYEVGSSYIKVIQACGSGVSVHSFIVNKSGKFPLGDVLKPASWRGPATNFARANVLKPESWKGHITWTGAH